MQDSIRLLGKSGGYTDRPDRAMDRDEPEAVDAETQRRISRAAVESWPHMNALQTAARTSLPRSVRLARAKAQARHLGVDMHQELRLARLAIEGGRSDEHVERRIATIESRLWPSRGEPADG